MANTAADNNASETEDYYDKVHRKTWIRRVAGFMGGATLFGAIGAIGGAIAAFMPYVFGALGIAGATTVGLPAIGAVLSTAAIFAAGTGLLGMIIGADVGSNAGSVAAGLEEKEKREKTTGISRSPGQANEKDAKSPPFFNWKTGAVSAGLFAAFGALMAFNPITSVAVVSTLGFPTASAAAVTASATVMGMLGVTIGMPFAHYSNQLSNYYADIITGKTFEKKPVQQDAAMPSQAMITHGSDMPVISEPQREGRSFASDKLKFSLKELVEKSEEATPSPDMLARR